MRSVVVVMADIFFRQMLQVPLIENDHVAKQIATAALQLAMYARRAPGWVLADHAEDESAQFPANTSSSSPVPMPRDPRPIQLETGPMPPNDSVCLNED